MGRARGSWISALLVSRGHTLPVGSGLSPPLASSPPTFGKPSLVSCSTAAVEPLAPRSLERSRTSVSAPERYIFVKIPKAKDGNTHIDTLLSLNLDGHRDTLLSGNILTDLLALVVAIFLKVDNSTLNVYDGLALLFISRFQLGITTRVKSCHTLSLNLSCEGVFENGFTAFL